MLPRLRPALLALLALLPVPARAEEPAAARPPLWKVADADTTIYLFGTIHALPQGVNWLSGPVAAALEASDELVTELPEVEMAQLQAIVAQRAILPAGRSLRGSLPAADRATLEAALARYALPLDALDRYEPWFAYFVLFRVALGQEGVTAEAGVEQVLARRMATLGRPRQGLETMDYQLALFDGLPEAVQRKLLLALAESGPTLRDDLDQIVREWSAGDPETIAKLVNEGEDEPELVETLLIGRNRNWAQWIRARLDRPGTSFVAVGAGHLAGQGSVQDQLGALGVATTRVQ